jgi:hypothetical protein
MSQPHQDMRPSPTLLNTLHQVQSPTLTPLLHQDQPFHTLTQSTLPPPTVSQFHTSLKPPQMDQLFKRPFTHQPPHQVELFHTSPQPPHQVENHTRPSKPSTLHQVPLPPMKPEPTHPEYRPLQPLSHHHPHHTSHLQSHSPLHQVDKSHTHMSLPHQDMKP